MKTFPLLFRRGREGGGGRTWLTLVAGFCVSMAGAVEVAVELEGAVNTAFDREVVFVATDGAGTPLNSWTENLTFENGTASITLPNEAGMEFLSAKTSTSLRSKVEVVAAAASFTATNHLKGGDLNADNVVDSLDFATLRFHWYQSNGTADITGNGSTGSGDYAILKSNWKQKGDPE